MFYSLSYNSTEAKTKSTQQLFVYLYISRLFHSGKDLFYKNIILIKLFCPATCDLPFTLVYLYHEHVAFSSDVFCKYWLILLSALDLCSVQLNAYLSIERYLLIFHSQFFNK
jgi:hypothetical protein